MLDELPSSLTVDQLKPRLALLRTQERPTRKADIIALLRRHLLSPQLRDYWEDLESVDRYAVAEALHNWNGRFDPIRFSNKYSDIPEIFRAGGTSGSRRSKRADSTLSLFNSLMARSPASLAGMIKAPSHGTPRRLDDFDPASLLARERDSAQ